MSRKTARQREETPVCAMCLEPYAVPSPGETIFSCTACSAVLHGECYKRFKDADRQRAQARYEAQIEAHQASRPDALCSPQVFPCTRCPECRRPNTEFVQLPKKHAKPVRVQKEELRAELTMLRERQDRIRELRRLVKRGQAPANPVSVGQKGKDALVVCRFFILMAEENLERLERGEPQKFEWPRRFRGSLPTPTLHEPAD